MDVSIADVRLAAERLGDAVLKPPFLHSQTLSEMTGADIWLKFENLQFTGSFKERGALNRLLSLTEDERKRGVVTVSAGNHAQGVALHARRLGVPATIVMPSTTPGVKVARTATFGATVVLTGKDFAEASASIPEYVAQGLTFIPPFDDPQIIAGQGTVALEMMEQGPPLDIVLVSVGGGGLIGGVGTVFKALSPHTEVIGVESELYPSMARALKRYRGPPLGGTSIAEGIAVAQPGKFTLSTAQRVVDDMIVVSEALIEDSVAYLLQIEKTVCEGAGAAGLGAILAQPERFRGRRVGLILCGGNIDIRLLNAMLQRHLARAGQLIRFRVAMLNDPSALGTAAAVIGQEGGTILDVAHDRIFSGASPRSAAALFTIELPDSDHDQRIRNALSEAGFEVFPETSKNAVRNVLKEKESVV